MGLGHLQDPIETAQTDEEVYSAKGRGRMCVIAELTHTRALLRPRWTASLTTSAHTNGKCTYICR